MTIPFHRGLRRLQFLAIAFGVLASAPAGAAAPGDTPQIVENAVAGFVRPGYARFEATADALARKTAALCGAPSAAVLEEARSAFAATVAAWSRIEVIRFGPVVEDNRLERILFWPDRKGIGLRQVQAILAAEDPDLTDPEKLSVKSVAVQGLGALDFVLAGSGSESLAGQSGAYRCAYGAAVAGAIRDRAHAIRRDWADQDGIAGRWSHPHPDNPLYRDNEEAFGELVDVFVHGLELVRDVRIGGFLAEEPQKDRPRQALFRRSGLTVAAIRGNLAALDDLFAVSGMAEELPKDEAWIAKSIAFEFGNAETALDGLDGPIEEILADPERRAKLAYAALVTSSLSELFASRLSAAFGLTTGFSSLDGD